MSSRKNEGWVPSPRPKINDQIMTYQTQTTNSPASSYRLEQESHQSLDGSFNSQNSDSLSPQDYQELAGLGLTKEQILRLGHFSILDAKQGKKQTGIKHRGLVFRYLDPSSGQPYRTPSGKPFYRMKIRDWHEHDWSDPTETPPKYLSPKGFGNKPYWSPLIKHFNRLSQKTRIPLVLTEGEKKADALAARGQFVCGLAGVYGWLDKQARIEETEIPPAQTIEDDEEAQDALDEPLEQSRLIPELREAIAWEGRKVIICFDSDLSDKPQVRLAMKDLAKALSALGAHPHVLRLPNELDGGKNGIDDFLSAHGFAAYEKLQKTIVWAIKGNQLNFKQDPPLYHKILQAWSVLKEVWRLRPGTGWHQWTGQRWEVRPTAEFEADLIQFQDSQNWIGCSGMDTMKGQLSSRLLVKPESWNPEHLIVFANGTLDTRTGEFTKEHRHEDFCTQYLPYDYNPLATCPTWEKFLGEALQGDIEAIEVLQAFVKWVLIPKPKNRKAEIEKCLDLLGPKGSGKGTFLDTVAALVGTDNVGAINQETFTRFAFLAPLLDKKVSIDFDASGYVASAGLFNKVVSNEIVPLKRVYKDVVNVRLGTTLIRAYNQVLDAPQGSEGLDRRIIAVSFDHKPETIDLELAEKLQRELSGIFAWAWSVPMPEVKRRLVWQAGHVRSVAKASIERFQWNNREFVFLEEHFPNGGNIRSSQLYASYKDWMAEEGAKALSQKKFNESILKFGCVKDTSRSDAFYFIIPAMSEFDIPAFLGLSKSISEKLVSTLHSSTKTPEMPSGKDLNPPLATMETLHNPPNPPREEEENSGGFGGSGDFADKPSTSYNPDSERVVEGSPPSGGLKPTFLKTNFNFRGGDRVKYVGDDLHHIKAFLNKKPTVHYCYDNGMTLLSDPGWHSVREVPAGDLELVERPMYRIGDRVRHGGDGRTGTILNDSYSPQIPFEVKWDDRSRTACTAEDLESISAEPSSNPHYQGVLEETFRKDQENELDDAQQRQIEKELFEKNPELAKLAGFFDAVEQPSEVLLASEEYQGILVFRDREGTLAEISVHFRRKRDAQAFADEELEALAPGAIVQMIERDPRGGYSLDLYQIDVQGLEKIAKKLKRNRKQ